MTIVLLYKTMNGDGTIKPDSAVKVIKVTLVNPSPLKPEKSSVLCTIVVEYEEKRVIMGPSRDGPFSHHSVYNILHLSVLPTMLKYSNRFFNLITSLCLYKNINLLFFCRSNYLKSKFILTRINIKT